WLVLGRSAKAARSHTPLGRLPVGDKGLGRLAALRMGSVAELRTRPAQEPGWGHPLVLYLTHLTHSPVVEDVPLSIDTYSTSESPGTTISVFDLSVALSRREMERLARALLLLADPFDDTTGFHPELAAREFADLERRVREGYFNDTEFHLT